MVRKSKILFRITDGFVTSRIRLEYDTVSDKIYFNTTYSKNFNQKHNKHKYCKCCDKLLIKDVNWRDTCYKSAHYICNDCSIKNERFRYDGSYIKIGKNNKLCPTYLGIDITETILSHVFQDVERMRGSNKGFDFICVNGYKIDAKSSCIRKTMINRKNIYWTFNISKNTIADYFICLAYDNREDINPLHIWLIPSNDINHLMTLTINQKTINKWSKYEMSLDKVLDCCNTMKGGI